MASFAAFRLVDAGRRLTRSQLLLDAALALAAFGIALGLLAAGGDIAPLSAALAALSSLPVAASRLAPLAIYAFAMSASAALYALDPLGPPLGPAIALYHVASSRDETRARPRLTAVVIVGFFVGHMLAAFLGRDSGVDPFPEALIGILLWAAIWFAGDRAALRRERLGALKERAERAEREAQRDRRLAAAEERARIARDLHDSAGHAINVILVQAGAARLLQEQDPARSRGALATIEQVARETIGEIDRIVRALRDDAPANGEVEPPAGLAALETLAARHRGAGLSVEIEWGDGRRSLAPAVDAAAYRILQEALTNASLHGGGAARVGVRFRDEELELTVANPVRSESAARPGGGHGIVGMRERAALLGGEIDVESDGDAFRVVVRLPYAGGDP